jgi:hypothetical protein
MIIMVFMIMLGIVKITMKLFEEYVVGEYVVGVMALLSACSTFIYHSRLTKRKEIYFVLKSIVTNLPIPMILKVRDQPL